MDENRRGATWIPWLNKWVCQKCFDVNDLAALDACPGPQHFDGDRS